MIEALFFPENKAFLFYWLKPWIYLIFLPIFKKRVVMVELYFKAAPERLI